MIKFKVINTKFHPDKIRANPRYCAKMKRLLIAIYELDRLYTNPNPDYYVMPQLKIIKGSKNKADK